MSLVYPGIQVDNTIRGDGVPVRARVKVASQVNITLSPAPATVDSISIASGDRVFVKAQSTGSQNGIYEHNGTDLIRAADYLNGTSAASTLIAVNQGTDANTVWICSAALGSDLIGTDALTFVQLGDTAVVADTEYINVPSATTVSNTLKKTIINSTVSDLTYWSAFSEDAGTRRTPQASDADSSSVYIGSSYSATITIDDEDGTLFDTRAVVATQSSLLTKYDLTGVVQWAARITSSSGSNFYNDVSVNSTDSSLYGAVVTPSGSTTTFYSGTDVSEGTGVSTTNVGYVVKYNSDGTLAWRAQVNTGGSTSGSLGAVDVNTSGIAAACITGTDAQLLEWYNSDTAAVNPDTIVGDGSIVRYLADGTLDWRALVTISGADNVWYFHDCAIDNSGNVYFTTAIDTGTTFTFNSAVGSGGGTFGPVSDNSSYHIVKYNSLGVVQWGINMQGAWSVNVPMRIVTDSGGNVYVSVFDNSGSMPVYDVGGLVFTTGALSGILCYMIKYDTNGNYLSHAIIRDIDNVFGMFDSSTLKINDNDQLSFATQGDTISTPGTFSIYDFATNPAVPPLSAVGPTGSLVGGMIFRWSSTGEGDKYLYTNGGTFDSNTSSQTGCIAGDGSLILTTSSQNATGTIEVYDTNNALLESITAPTNSRQTTYFLPQAAEVISLADPSTNGFEKIVTMTGTGNINISLSTLLLPDGTTVSSFTLANGYSYYLLWNNVDSQWSVVSTGVPAQIVSASNSISINPSSYELLDDMIITPPAGTYLVNSSFSGEGNASQVLLLCAIYVGGVVVDGSERRTRSQLETTIRFPYCFATQALVTVNGTQAIETRVRITGGATFNIFSRSMSVLKIN